MKYLKSIRVVFAVLFILVTSSLFFNFNFLLSGKWDNFILSFQFIPSFLKLIRGVSFIAIGFIAFTLLAFVFGRWYCSFICPLGILQDIFIRINKFLFKKRKLKYSFKNSLPWLKYVILFLSIGSLILGSSLMFIIFDPYSNFGRISTHIFQPIYLILNNFIATIVNHFNLYGIYHRDFEAFNLFTFLFASGVVALLLFLTHKRGRLFCNTLCPVGAFLGLASKFSIFKLKFDADKCISCSLCEKACKSESIDYKKMNIDFERCVSCFNCVQVCSKDAISYKFSRKDSIKKINNSSKRNTLKILVTGIIGVSGLSFRIDKDQFSSFKSKIPAKSKYPVMPPGAISIEHYKETCTACNLCVSSCPSHVLQSSFLDFGIDGIFIPKMDYSVEYCQFECNLCSQVCPTGALRPLKLEDKKINQIGKVHFVKGNCVVSQLEQNCGACAEHCPTTAVKMVPYKNDLFIPEVNTDICIGCGACEYPCPARPHKAIYVESNLNHLLAQTSKVKSTEQKEDVEEEFPF